MTSLHPILIVDDDELYRDLFASYFENLCDVRTAGSGHEAMEILRKTKIDIVFSDVQMANGNGIELLDWITTSKELTQKPVVVMITGQSSLTEETASKKGAYSLIHKPFPMDMLKQVFDKICA